MPVVFQNVTPRTLEQALGVYRDASRAPQGRRDDRDAIGELLRRDMQKGALYLIEENGQTIGAVSMGALTETAGLPFDDRAENACELARLAIAEAFRGAGAGIRALHAALAFLSKQGWDAVRLLVREDDAPAQKLFQNAGFCACGAWDGQDARYLCMSRPLQKSEPPLRVRAARLEDAQELLAIYAPYVRDTAITFAYDPPTLAQFRATMEKTLARYPYIVAQRGGRLEGYAYASPFHEREAYGWDCELSIYVRRDARASGVGGVLYDWMEKLLGAQGIFNLYACIAETSVPDAHLTNASREFHMRRGFSLVARFAACGYKFHRWYDMIWMHKSLVPDAPVPPPALLTFDQVRASFGLDEARTQTEQ